MENEEKKFIFNIIFWGIMFMYTLLYFLTESLDEWKNPELIIIISGLIISFFPLYLFIAHIRIYNKLEITSKYFQKEFYSNIICLVVLILTIYGNIQSRGEFMQIIFLVPIIFILLIISLFYSYKGFKEIETNQ